jgi:general secretion pathway protein G
MRIFRQSRRRDERGISFTEVLVVSVILVILATAALPLATYVHQRAKEDELERALRSMRSAIDRYNDYARKGQIQPWDVSWDQYPQDFEMLVEGVEVTEAQAAQPYTVKFLRAVPWDPITESYDWGMRSYRDDFDSNSWGGENLYDVYCNSTDLGMNGRPYNEW